MRADRLEIERGGRARCQQQQAACDESMAETDGAHVGL
jgi:hypothetical protein